MQPSSFFWNFSYIAGASSNDAVCVLRSSTPSGSDGSSTSGSSVSVQERTLHWTIRSWICLSNIVSIGIGSFMPP